MWADSLLPEPPGKPLINTEYGRKKKFKPERKKALVSMRIKLNALQRFYKESPGKHSPGEIKTVGNIIQMLKDGVQVTH